MITFDTLDLVTLTMADRQREAEHGRLVAFARRVAACCTRASLRSRLVGFSTSAGDTCCGSPADGGLSIVNDVRPGC